MFSNCNDEMFNKAKLRRYVYLIKGFIGIGMLDVSLSRQMVKYSCYTKTGLLYECNTKSLHIEKETDLR